MVDMWVETGIGGCSSGGGGGGLGVRGQGVSGSVLCY